MNKKISRQLLLLAVCILVALVIYSAIRTWAGIPNFKALFDRFSDVTLIKIFLLSIFACSCRFIAWHLNLVYLGAKVPIFFDLLCYLAGYLFLPTPARAGTSIRIFYLRQYIPYSISGIALILERLQDLIATVIFALFLIKDIHYWILFVLVTLFLLNKYSFLQNKNYLDKLPTKRIKAIIPVSIEQKIKRLFIAIKEEIKTKPSLIRSPTIISSQILFCLAYISYGLILYTALTNFQIDISVWRVISIYSASIFFGSISFLPVGLGGAEVMTIVFLTVWNVTRIDAVAVTLISRLFTIWLMVFVGSIATLILLIKTKKLDRI